MQYAGLHCAILAGMLNHPFDRFPISIGTKPNLISCAGVPEKVIKRAASVLEAIAQNKHVERLCDESIAGQEQLYMVLI